jgi:hypothetical protein
MGRMGRVIGVGDRVVYVAPAPPQPSPRGGSGWDGGVREGVVVAISGVSALVLYEGEQWPRWGPLERMTVVVGVDGQLRLL